MVNKGDEYPIRMRDKIAQELFNKNFEELEDKEKWKVHQESLKRSEKIEKQGMEMTESQRTGKKPPKDWFDRCTTRAESFADDPEAYCGALWYHGKEEWRSGFGKAEVNEMLDKAGDSPIDNSGLCKAYYINLLQNGESHDIAINKVGNLITKMKEVYKMKDEKKQEEIPTPAVEEPVEEPFSIEDAIKEILALLQAQLKQSAEGKVEEEVVTEGKVEIPEEEEELVEKQEPVETETLEPSQEEQEDKELEKKIGEAVKKTVKEELTKSLKGFKVVETKRPLKKDTGRLLGGTKVEMPSDDFLAKSSWGDIEAFVNKMKRGA
jgi:hypothetical protein